MSIRTARSGTRIAAAATDSYTFPIMTGKLLRVDIVNSASTDYKVYTLQSDGATVDEYILGAAEAVVTVASGSKFYPGVALCGVDGAAITAGANAVPFVIGWKQIKVNASNLTAADTWSIELTYEL